MRTNAKQTAEELRCVTKNPSGNACDEDGAELLAALDAAVKEADQPGSPRYSPDDVRSRLRVHFKLKLR